jgi:hypothetical protein
MNKKDFGYNTDCCCLTDREINQILIKENQALKDRWNILKDWISNSDEVLLYSITDKPAKIGNKRYNYFERKQLLDKMQELEQEFCEKLQ